MKSWSWRPLHSHPCCRWSLHGKGNAMIGIHLTWRRLILSSSAGLLAALLVALAARAEPFAYVSNSSAGTVSVIDTATNGVVATVPVGQVPEFLAITPDGARAYVANLRSNTVSVIATDTNTVVATVPVGANPVGVAATPDGTRVYVTNQSSRSVSVIATATNSVQASVPLGVTPGLIAITPDGALAYVTGFTGGVSVISTSTNTVVASIPVGVFVVGLAVTPDGSRLYVTDQLLNTVFVIATATNTVVAAIPVGALPTGVAITPDGSRAYVMNQNDGVSVIDTATHAVTSAAAVNAPVAAAVTPDGAHVYMTHFSSGNVSVIATATNTLAAIVPVGGAPLGVAITPAVATTGCPRSRGFWKTHADTWPATSLVVGRETYSQPELLAILRAPVVGDASVLLAQRLIAAKLNRAEGAGSPAIDATIAHADGLLGGFSSKLPYEVRMSSALGKQMQADAIALHRFDRGCQR